MKRLLSLFDFSGQWPKYFLDNGWDVIQWDIKFQLDVLLLKDVETCLDLLESIDGIIAGPPCTEFTVSGAQYWPIKDQDGRTARALELVYQVQRLADLFTPTDEEYEEGFFWALENPVGRLPKLVPELGKPFYFDPFEYAGYLNLSCSDHNELDRIRMKDGKDVSAEEVQFVIDCNAYTKKTGLWGNFNSNMIKKPIEPVRLCKQGSFTQRLGGDNERTKELRSITPLGFSKAFYEAQIKGGYYQPSLF